MRILILDDHDCIYSKDGPYKEPLLMYAVSELKKHHDIFFINVREEVDEKYKDLLKKYLTGVSENKEINHLRKFLFNKDYGIFYLQISQDEIGQHFNNFKKNLKPNFFIIDYSLLNLPPSPYLVGNMNNGCIFTATDIKDQKALMQMGGSWLSKYFRNRAQIIRKYISNPDEHKVLSRIFENKSKDIIEDILLLINAVDRKNITNPTIKYVMGFSENQINSAWNHIPHEKIEQLLATYTDNESNILPEKEEEFSEIWDEKIDNIPLSQWQRYLTDLSFVVAQEDDKDNYINKYSKIYNLVLENQIANSISAIQQIDDYFYKIMPFSNTKSVINDANEPLFLRQCLIMYIEAVINNLLDKCQL